MSIDSIRDIINRHQNQAAIGDNFYKVISPFLTETGMAKLLVEKNINSLWFADFKAEAREVLILQVQEVRTLVVFEMLKNMVRAGLHGSPQEKEEFVNSEKNAPLFTDLMAQANRVTKLAFVKFRNGESPLPNLSNIDLSTVRINTKLIGESQGKKQKEVYVPDSMANNPDKLRVAQMMFKDENPSVEEKKIIFRRKKLFQNQLVRDEIERSDQTSKLLNQFKKSSDYYLFLSSKLKIDLDKLTDAETDCETNRKAFEDFQESRRVQLEAKRLLEIERSFGPAEPVKAKPKAKGKKKHLVSIHTKTAVENAPEVQAAPVLKATVDKVVEAEPCIFNQKIEFFVDKRIARWFSATSEKIKNFEDRLLSAKVYHYQKLHPKELEQQRLYHRLPGVERLMSLPKEILQRYSTPYQFMHHGVARRGLCLSVHLKKGCTEEKGMIYIGMDGKRIYHAQFVPFVKKDFTASDLCLPLEGLDSQADLPKAEGWQLQGGYGFRQEDDGTIVWLIEDDSLVEFQIQPLY